MTYNNKAEIIEGLSISASDITNWLIQQPEEKFVMGPKGKWDTSQHLDHLHQAITTINKVLRFPKFIIRWRFGKPNRESRDYNAVVTRYKTKLKKFDGNNNPNAGKKHPIEEKNKLLADFELQIQRLKKALDKWTEEELDQYLVPHPLMGKLTIRELVMWTIYHHYHHLNILKANY